MSLGAFEITVTWRTGLYRDIRGELINRSKNIRHQQI